MSKKKEDNNTTQEKVTMNNSESTAIVKADEMNYPILSMRANQFNKIIERNVGAENLNPFAFQRIKIPSGGGLQFEIPDFDTITHVSSFRCLLMYKKRRADKAFWKEPYGTAGASVQPDCFSRDGVYGTGMPGGYCDKCPLNEFGSGEDSKGNKTKGKRCRDSLLTFPTFEGNLLPMRFSLPPTSIGNFNNYGLQLASYCNAEIQGLQYFEVVTEVSLERVETPVLHSRAVFKVARDENNKPIIFGAEKRAHLERLIYGDEDNPGMQSMFESLAADIDSNDDPNNEPA